MENVVSWLIEKADFYNQAAFIESDPIQIPHRFSKKEDIEIAGLITAIIAWGNRKSILSSASRLLQLMDNTPFDFVVNHSEKDLVCFSGFAHRTFNASDAATIISMLKVVYCEHKGLQNAFSVPLVKNKQLNAFDAITYFRKLMLTLPHEKRFEKHFSSPEKGSAAKRLNMFLRWMVRRDDRGVDFGLWTDTFPMSRLLMPLDVHSARVARNIGILQRKQNDNKAVIEISDFCASIDSSDPARFDFALFGTGVYEKHYL
ncbi:MAG: TIGR02757 family protein [Bacteroidetes bacterium HGW-Bacteroidetes-6]|jgi:uncharacterized protein (TIGR02757 family)|nr:MAG: TIGR02757 family protein [Bacteroidetes bacterium HGW-Bacteroidetes-6]